MTEQNDHPSQCTHQVALHTETFLDDSKVPSSLNIFLKLECRAEQKDLREIVWQRLVCT